MTGFQTRRASRPCARRTTASRSRRRTSRSSSRWRIACRRRGERPRAALSARCVAAVLLEGPWRGRRRASSRPSSAFRCRGRPAGHRDHRVRRARRAGLDRHRSHREAHTRCSRPRCGEADRRGGVLRGRFDRAEPFITAAVDGLRAHGASACCQALMFSGLRCDLLRQSHARGRGCRGVRQAAGGDGTARVARGLLCRRGACDRHAGR